MKFKSSEFPVLENEKISHHQMKPGDILERRCPTTGLIVQWRVEGVYLQGLGGQSYVDVVPITKTKSVNKVFSVPEEMTRDLHIFRVPK